MLTLGIDSTPKLSSQNFIALRDIIYSRSGIFFADNKKYLLETRLARRLEHLNLKRYEDYVMFLSYDKDREKEVTELINSVVINETSFFRDQMQLDAFGKGVVPGLIERNSKEGNRNLRIWSSACSTGEEPYTLAIMLLEAGLHLNWSINILGSDISPNVLRSAELASYEKYSLRNLPEPYLRKYFFNDGDSFRLKKNVLDLVKFKRINLIDSLEMRQIREMDVIFCRNVLIYFDDASRKKAISHLYDSLAKGGYLFLGFSETLHNITRLFRPVSFERSLVYQKI
jgi:chemotaxis protein methyltransferase CheR